MWAAKAVFSFKKAIETPNLCIKKMHKVFIYILFNKGLIKVVKVGYRWHVANGKSIEF
jgi:hypothetical protein